MTRATSARIALVLAIFGLGSSAMAAPCLCGDMNADGQIKGNDIQCFVNCITNQPGTCPNCACADFNNDTFFTSADIPAFVQALLFGSAAMCGAPTQTETYEPGALETPPAAPFAEAAACQPRPESGTVNSVYLFNGEFHHTAVDMRIKGRGLDFVWSRKYRSRLGPNTDQGNQWDFSYNIYLEEIVGNLILHDGNSRADLYTLQPNGKWARDGFFREIEDLGTQYRLTFADGGVWEFHPITGNPQPSAGRIKAIRDRNGNSILFSYQGPGGRLSAIQDTLSRQILIAYDANNRISTVTDFTGRQVMYTYYNGVEPGGGLHDLKSARSPIVVGTPNGNDFPAGKTSVYTYSAGFVDNQLNHNLLTITDAKGQTYLTNVYDATTNPLNLNYDRVVQQRWPGPVAQRIDFFYQTQAPGPANNNAVIRAIVNDRGTFNLQPPTPLMSNVREYFYDAANRVVMAREYTGRATADQPTTDVTNRPTNKLRATDPDYFETRWNYNVDSLVTLRTLPNLNTVANTYELALNPAADRRLRGNLRQTTRTAGPLGGDQASITSSMTYEPGFGNCGCGGDFVKVHTDGRGNTTTHTYDIHGNRTHTDHRVGGGVEDWTYNFAGQVESHRLPANGSGFRRLDAFEYYGLADPPAMRGYLKRATIDSGGQNLITTYEYDPRGNIITTFDPAGRDSLRTYNALDQIVREQSREVLPGVRYESLRWYDANDNLIRSDFQNRDENGVVQPNTHFSTIYEYDTLNRLTRMCQEKGAAALTNADLTCAAFPAGQAVTTEFVYDPNGNRLRVRSPEAVNGTQPTNVTDTQYDERDLVFKVVRAPGTGGQSTTQTDYDGNQNVKTTRQGLEDAGGVRITSRSYDGYNRLKTATDAMGNVTTCTYDANGNRLTERVDGELNDAPGGAGNVRLSERAYTYDAMDRRTRSDIAHFNAFTQVPIGDGLSTTITAYANNSQVTSVTDDRGNATTTIYDTANRRAIVTDAKGNTVAYAYDNNSNVLQVTETEKHDLPATPDDLFLTGYSYDPLDRCILVADPLFNLTAYAYDSRGNVVRTVDPLGREARFSYDGLGRRTRAVRDMDGDGADGAAPGDPDITTNHSFNDNSCPTGDSDDKGNTTAPQYDEQDRPNATDMADCTMPSAQYDVHDNRVSEVDANGTLITCAYDLLNRVTLKSIVPGPGVAGDTTFEAFAYDGLGRLVAAENDDSLVTRQYDSLSNVLVETQQFDPAGAASTITSTYDGLGNKLTCNYAGARTVTYTYDALNRKATISDNLLGPIAGYFYVGPHRVERRDLNANGTRCDYTWDGILASQPPGDFGVRKIVRTRHTVISSGNVIDDHSYLWNASGEKIERKDIRSAGPQLTFTYATDMQGRLTGTTVVNGSMVTLRTTNYTLDGVGNRLSVTGTGTLDPGNYSLVPVCPVADDEMNQYTTAPMGDRVYDEEGNLTSVNVGMGDQAAITYDYANRMVEWFSPMTLLRHTYAYDAFGRRISRTLDVDAVGGTPVTHRWLYDGWQEIVELSVPAAGIPRSFVYGNGIDEVLSMRRATSGGHFFYHADDLGNVVALTGIAGGIVERYEYDDYGFPVLPTTLAPIGGNPSPVQGNPHLFNGRRYDPETRLYHYRTRYLDPRAGRFTTRDRIGIWGDAANLGNGTAFVNSNPTSTLDPIGMSGPKKEIDPLEELTKRAAKGVIQRHPLGTGFIIILKLSKVTPPEEGAQMIDEKDTKDLSGTVHERWITTDNIVVKVTRRHGKIDDLDGIKAAIALERMTRKRAAIDSAYAEYKADLADLASYGNSTYESILRELNEGYPSKLPRERPALDANTTLKPEELTYMRKLYTLEQQLQRSYNLDSNQRKSLERILQQVKDRTYSPN